MRIFFQERLLQGDWVFRVMSPQVHDKARTNDYRGGKRKSSYTSSRNRTQEVDEHAARERGDVRRRRERLHTTRQVIEVVIDRFRPISIR